MAAWVVSEEVYYEPAGALLQGLGPNGSRVHTCMHACLGMCKTSLVSFVFGQRTLIQRQYSNTHARIGSEHDLLQELRLPVKVTHRVKIEVMVVCTNT